MFHSINNYDVDEFLDVVLLIIRLMVVLTDVALLCTSVIGKERVSWVSSNGVSVDSIYELSSFIVTIIFSYQFSCKGYDRDSSMSNNTRKSTG